AIARAKYELIESLPAGGLAILNADDEYVSQFGRDFHGKVITYGMNKPADVSARHIESQGPQGSAFEIVADGKQVHAVLPLLGEHNIYNALAALTVARPSSTIATIPIRRHSTAWFVRWRSFRRSVASWLRAKCWNLVRQGKACTAIVASTWRIRGSMCCLASAGWQRRWSRVHRRQECVRSS